MHNSEQSLSNQYSISAETFEHGKRLKPMETEEMGQPKKRSRSLKQDNASSVGTLEDKDRTKKDNKIKASNFAALRLRIGSWEHKSNSAGLGLKAKIYFNDSKLVWELLVGDLKYKMEIHWSDITALEANCPNNQPGTLRIVLGKKPLFFEEDNPQPKKRTKWKELSEDFTGGHASTHLEHFLEITQGVLDKHYDKLIQCDTRLRLLSQQRESISHPPSFVTEASNSVVGLSDNGGNLFETARGFSSSALVRGSCISGLQEVAPIFSGLNVKQRGSLPALDKSHEDLFKYLSLSSSSARGSSSPSSVRGSCISGLQDVTPIFSGLNVKQRGSLPPLDKSHEDLFKYTSLSPRSARGSSSPSSVRGSCISGLQDVTPIFSGLNVKQRGSLPPLDKSHEDLFKYTSLSPSSARGSSSPSSVRGSCISGLQDVTPIFSGLNVKQRALPPLDKSHEDLFKYTSLSPSSVIGSCATKMNSNSEVDNFQNLKDLQHFGVAVPRTSPFIGGCVERYILEETTLEEDQTDINYLDKMLHNTTEFDENFLMSCLDEFDWDDDSTPWNRLVNSQMIKGDEVVEPDDACVLMHENNVQGDNFLGQEEKGRLNDVTGHKQLQGMSDSDVEFMHGLPRALIPYLHS